MFTVTITDSLGAIGAATFTLRVDWPLLSIETSALPNGLAGAPYSQALSASGGSAPYAWSVSNGALPAGVTLGAGGVLGGTPAGGGTTCVTFQCVSGDGQAAVAPLCVKIIGAPATSAAGVSIKGVAIR